MGSYVTHTGRQAMSFWLACCPDSFSGRRQMKLHEDQLNLIRHTIRFPVTDYLDCLEIPGGTEGGDRVKLSYAFRPLTKNGYLAKRKDGSVTVLAKGRALFPEERPLISAGGGAAERQRLMGSLPRGGADGTERGACRGRGAGDPGASIYPLRLLAKNCAGHSVHDPVCGNADSL